MDERYREIARKWCSETEDLWWDEAEVLGAIAEAVAEERERASKTFEAWGQTILHGDEKRRQWLLDEIAKCAAAIRRAP